ncbi:hypothetical protein [Pandoraea sputorum]|uniref:hypothetical protein n=1 Tax=Pandoraea sputorum TaxID=93222 RepID=UPI0012402A3B|nr:hypothetical protein [Pandoraea sputorum]VVE77381.1 hypothetical protein PSP31120_01263 [Pandoraea sputorum]
MAFKDCIDAINKAAGRALSDDEHEALQSMLQSRTRYLAARDAATDLHQAALQAAEELAGEVRMASAIEKRNAAINAAVRLERVAWVQKQFGRNFAEGLEAMLVGVNRAKEGSRRSVMSVQKTMRDQYLSGFIADIERTGLRKQFADGSMDRDVWRALWSLEDGAELAKVPKEAVQIAQAVHKWMEVARVDANDAGAWIKKLPGYVIRQTHDMESIRRAGRDEWTRDAAKWFDLARMASDEGRSIPDILEGLYRNLASGLHMKAVPAGEISGFKGPANIAKKMSQDRTIHFKDADAAYEYNQKYGMKSLREGVVGALSRSADSTGMMKVLGPNPGAMFDTIRSDLELLARDTDNLPQIDKIRNARTSLENYMKAVDGSMSIPGNAMAAKVASNYRALQSMAKLGGMILSQFNDIAVYGSEAKYQGRGYLSGMAESVAGLGANLKKQERLDLLSSIGVALESMVGDISRTGSFEEPGMMSKLQRQFFRLNLGQWWTEHQRAAASLGMAHHMALQSAKGFEHLSPDYQRVLSLYNIGAKEWDVIRSSTQKNVDGRAYITPDLVEKVSDDVVGKYLADGGRRAEAPDIARTRSEIADNLMTYINDRTTFAQLEPDAKTRAMLLQGTQSGTWLGEFMRFLMQFKSFTGAYMQKIMGRELYGRGFEGDGIHRAIFAGNGEFLGLAQVIALSTVAGYGSMVAKDLLKGRTPRVPGDDPMENAKLMMAAMVQGGGMGIMGDFLFGEANRFGGGMASSLLGPGIGSVLDVTDLWQKLKEGDDVKAQAFRTLINNTPFLNLFYARMALDYLVFYRMQEMMNPGYLSRMESRVKHDNNQSFILPPSQYSRSF